ncbi:unnamed protein product, partial [Mesorhabditis belari]|uniref:Uncharacterized protein n=1 Tax=Mesorhabditis belari TaxID=2138241 RepID=A0AAF3J3J6_9BILA
MRETTFKQEFTAIPSTKTLKRRIGLGLKLDLKISLPNLKRHLNKISKYKKENMESNTVDYHYQRWILLWTMEAHGANRGRGGGLVRPIRPRPPNVWTQLYHGSKFDPNLLPIVRKEFREKNLSPKQEKSLLKQAEEAAQMLCVAKKHGSVVKLNPNQWKRLIL